MGTLREVRTFILWEEDNIDSAMTFTRASDVIKHSQNQNKEKVTSRHGGYRREREEKKFCSTFNINTCNHFPEP